MRRKLFAYTLMYAAGIIPGFFLFERTRLAAGIFMMLTFAAICVILSMDPCRHHHQHLTASYSAPEMSVKECIILIAALLAGFTVFGLRYAYYEADAAYVRNMIRQQSSENIVQITGRVVSVRSTGSGCRLVLRCSADISPDAECVSENVDDISPPAEGVSENMKDISPPASGVRVLVSCYDTEADPAVLTGNFITAYGRYSEPDSADNPGCFDYRLYLRSMGISRVFRARHFELSSNELRYGHIHDNTMNSLVDKYHDETAGPDENTITAERAAYDEPGTLISRISDKRWSIRRRMMMEESRFLSMFGDDVRGLIRGMIFGDKSEIDEETIESFNANSTGHILAVSGLHVGFLYSLIRAALRRRRTRGSAILIIIVLMMYGEMTLWSPSTVRAVSVMGISVMSVHFRRPFDLLSSVSAAGIVMLVTEPYQLFNTGFQMSFIALLGIAVTGRSLSYIAGNEFGVMMGVQIAAAPIAAYVFHRFNPASVLINIPVIMLASILVPLCIILLFTGMLTGIDLSRGVIGLCTRSAEGLAQFTVRINERLSGLGISALMISVNMGLIALFYLTVFLLASEWTVIRVLRKERRRIVRAIVCVVVIALCFGWCGWNTFARDEVVFVAVGQGDCTHIRDAGMNVLIDGGGRQEYNVGRKILMPYLLSNGTESVDMALVTHLHTDHYKGIRELSEVYPVGRIGMSEDYRRSASEKWGGIEGGNGMQRETNHNTVQEQCSEKSQTDPDKIVFLRTGDRIDISERIYIEPIWPLPGRNGNLSVDDENENNMVYMVHFRLQGSREMQAGESSGEVRIMVTGDLLAEDELEMVRHYRGTDTLKCDVLKVAHHGSKSSSSDEFLDAADPEAAVIQVGRNNMYGHPHEETLEKLAVRGIPVYRTDQNGAVGIDITGRGLRIHTMRTMY